MNKVHLTYLQSFGNIRIGKYIEYLLNNYKFNYLHHYFIETLSDY